MRTILGLSAFYHDSAAVLVRDGEVVAAAQEERFSRLKNDAAFPSQAIAYCLRQAGITPAEVDLVAWYEKPLLKFTRTLETFLALAPRGFRAWERAIPAWFGERLDPRGALLADFPDWPRATPWAFFPHHEAHAASAFFPAPFASAAVLTLDGVGEWAATTIGRGVDGRVALIKELRFPHSLGLLYSALTAWCGFRVNSGEYKLMGLAPFGQPRYAEALRREVVRVREDGSLRLNLDYFDLLNDAHLARPALAALLGGPPRAPEGALDQRHADIARSIQEITQEVVLRLARHARDITGEENLCLAGGVALNCVANGALARAGLFRRIWVQPAAGDAGGALGAALAAWHGRDGAPPRVPRSPDAMAGSLLGPEFSNDEIGAALTASRAVFERLDDGVVIGRTVGALHAGQTVGWVQGRMEFGPRALGARSILADPRRADMQQRLNLQVKFREGFRPFAPAVLEERAQEFFEMEPGATSPYMLFTAGVRVEHWLAADTTRSGFDSIQDVRSTLPAITHVDHSARVQTVGAEAGPRFRALLEAWHEASGCPVLVNTSFNRRGEPLVCSPLDAFRCFLRTRLDVLVIGDFFLERGRQADGGAPVVTGPLALD